MWTCHPGQHVFSNVENITFNIHLYRHEASVKSKFRQELGNEREKEGKCGVGKPDILSVSVLVVFLHSGVSIFVIIWLFNNSFDLMNKIESLKTVFNFHCCNFSQRTNQCSIKTSSCR